MEPTYPQETHVPDDGGKLTDELLEEKLHEGKGPLPFVPGADGAPIVPPTPAHEPDEIS